MWKGHLWGGWLQEARWSRSGQTEEWDGPEVEDQHHLALEAPAGQEGLGLGLLLRVCRLKPEMSDPGSDSGTGQRKWMTFGLRFWVM